MNRIDRAAWKRIKARVAEPRTVTVFKGRSIGYTALSRETLETLRAIDKESKGRTRRFSIEKLFKDSDQVTRVAGRIAGAVSGQGSKP